MTINKDSYATLVLCSDLALREDDVKSYTTVQWFNLAQKLLNAKLTPEALFDIDKVKNVLRLDETETERISRLLDRAGKFGVAISNLNEKGIYTLTKSDSDYPEKLKSKLKKYAPPVLFYSGNIAIIKNKGVAIVGSRNIEEDAMLFTQKLARCCADAGVNIVSGGARGVDSVAEQTSNNADGTSLIFVADSLEKKIRTKETRHAIMRNETLVLSAQRPDMPFKMYTAMDRNKYIYAMADFVVAVSSDYNKGGTWSGAVENLKNGWTPLFVRNGEGVPKGNMHLIKDYKAFPITAEAFDCQDIFQWFDSASKKIEKSTDDGEQLSLF